MHPSGKSNEQTEAAASTGWTGPDRREADRRDAPTRLLPRPMTPARRERGRRASDHSSYVDRYTRRDVALLLTIFLLNVGDAFMTMLWLERGGREANPVMDFFLDIGPTAFLVQKCLVVGAWLVILVAHKNFRFARLGLYASLVVYAILMVIHFGIVAFDIEPPPPAEGLDRDAPGAAVHGAAMRDAAMHGEADDPGGAHSVELPAAHDATAAAAASSEAGASEADRRLARRASRSTSE